MLIEPSVAGLSTGPLRLHGWHRSSPLVGPSFLKTRWSLTMCAYFSELTHHLAVMHAHIMHISRLTAEMAICVESRAGRRLALDLSNAAFQVSINVQELDAESRRIKQIADELMARRRSDARGPQMRS
jgi:hypothetical protein